MEAPDKIYLPEEPFKDGNSEKCWNYKPIGGIEYIRTDVAIEKIEEFKSVLVEEIERRRKGWSYGSSIEAKYKREECDDILSWLEKQSNQKVTIDFKSTDWYVSKVDGKIHNIYGSGKSALEAINEENVDNANKVEPKFNVGDWVILTNETGEHTVKIIDISYFRDCHPMYITSEGKWFGNGTKARLWNINYAKDGDILYYDDEVFIYKNFDNSIGYYACWDGKNIHLNSFYLLTLEEMKTIKPATKEQREELLRHFSNAGYVFDITNKEILPKND